MGQQGASSTDWRDLEILSLREMLADAQHKLQQNECELDELKLLAAEHHRAAIEANHRIGNSLQLVTAALRLQQRDVPREARPALHDAEVRIMAVAHLHRQLSHCDADNLEFGTYLRELAREIMTSIKVLCFVDGNEIMLDAHTAGALGIIVNELVINAAKYAGDEPPIEISCFREGAHLKLSVRDHGPGFDGIVHEGSQGIRFVREITRNLRGELSVENRDGARLSVTIPYPH